MSLSRHYFRAFSNKLLRPLGYEIRRLGSVAPPQANVTLDWLRQYDIHTFIDVGAYVGEYVDFAFSFFPDVTVYAFEPLKDAFKVLEEKQSTNPKLVIFNCAIGDRDGVGEFHRSSYPPSSSLLQMVRLHKAAFPESADHETERVTIKRLDSVFRSLPLTSNLFVKVDTQGYEDKVIAGGQELLKVTKVVQIEVSFEVLYDGQLLFDEVYAQLRSLGFVFHGVKNQVCSPVNGEILQAHAFFIRQ
jgi:FkbM family methyltransferase